jgi:dienelactone hydrolase
VLAAGVVLFGAVAAAKLYADRERERWARTIALAEMQRLAGADRFDSMYALGVRVASLIPNDSGFVRSWRTMAFPTTIRTDPPGARVFRRPYADEDTNSLYLGTTPLDSVRLPFWASRLRVEHSGYRAQDLVAVTFVTITVGGSLLAERIITLDPGDAAPEDMVRAAGFALPQILLNLPAPMSVGDFWLDRYEVTNRRYREFVEAGGYQNREYWTERFVRNGREVPWEEAIRLFVDRTGQPGPSTWQAGSHPEAQDDHPVGGVSWYEAAAYAQFAGKRLPTYWHWRQGLPAGLLYLAVPRSNLARTGGPAPVGSFKGLGAFGTYDQAGNLREWTYNERAGERLIMGGAWSDPDWITLNPVTASPWDRSAINGIRLARYPEDTPALSRAHGPVPPAPPWREYAKERPASPREVQIFKRLYSYDALPLEPRLERADSARDWIRQRVSFSAAYGNQRMAAYLFLPRRGQPPYQTVIYWPGSFALNNRHIDELADRLHDFFVTAGRAVILPLYLGTFDRDDEQFSLASGRLPPATGSSRRDLVIQWVKDLRRSIDYLASRADIDTTKLAFYGHSWGGIHWPLVLAVEPHVKAGISFTGGLDNVHWLPEIDPFNFLSATRTPILMLASRYDPRFPFETSQKPMFELAGAPPEDKALFVYDGTHYVPLDIVARESLAWLDRYLGPVRLAP